VSKQCGGIFLLDPPVLPTSACPSQISTTVQLPHTEELLVTATRSLSLSL